MPLWGESDASSNVVKTVAMGYEAGSGGTAIAANNTAMYDNVTPGVFGTPPQAMAIGIFGVSAAEKANTGGESYAVAHAGWNVRKAGTGGVLTIAVAAGGTGYANTDTVVVSNGTSNASATLVTNSTGGITAVTLTVPGAGFTNTGMVATKVANSTGGNSAGSNASFTVTLGGRAGRVQYETIVAMGSMTNGVANTQFPH